MAEATTMHAEMSDTTKSKSSGGKTKKTSKNAKRNSAYTEWLVKTLVKFSEAWWLPILLFTVSCLNSLTGGMLIWCFGLTQGMMYTVLLLSRRTGVILAPAMVCCGSAVTAFTYMSLLKAGGAEMLLDSTGARDNAWFHSAHEYAEYYGAWGLFFLQVIPFPVPTAVIVTAGVLAEVEEWKIYSVVVGSKFCQLFLGACAMRYAIFFMGPKDLEGAIREQFGLGSGEDSSTDREDKKGH